jgi:hypothetical protein
MVLSTEVQAAELIATRLIYSATPKEREKFYLELDDHYQSQNLYECLNKLWNTSVQEWSEQQEEEFNKCDLQHILGMLAAEKKTCREKKYAWSPKYSHAVANKIFWKIALTLK